jgi:hypothetical protein
VRFRIGLDGDMRYVHYHRIPSSRLLVNEPHFRDPRSGEAVQNYSCRSNCEVKAVYYEQDLIK